MKKLSQLKIKQILTLRSNGYKYIDIQRIANVSYRSVQGYCSKYRPEMKRVASHKKCEEYIERITQLRRRGLSAKEIQKEIPLGARTIQEVCRKYCPGLRNIAQRKITQKQEASILDYYRERYPARRIAQFVKVNISTVYRIFKRYGYNSRLMYKDRPVRVA